MNMYLHELKAYRKSTLTWAVSLAFVTALLMSLFPTFSSSMEELKKIFEGFPPEILRAFGISPEALSVFLGFYSFIFMYITLCGAIQAMNLGTSLVSKEGTLKTADFILTKPVSRPRIITAKLAAGLTSIFITDVVFIVVAFSMAAIVNTDSYDVGKFILMSLTLPFVQLMFFSLGLLVSVLATKIKSVISVSLSTVFAFFIISMIRAALEDNRLRYLTPFDYFNYDYIIRNTAYEPSFVIIGAAFVVSSVVASYIIFSKKDIHAV